jgi:sulfite reductase beta subunit-like hemoprotein
MKIELEELLNLKSTGREELLRRYGIYSQRPPEEGFFTLRIQIPGGDLKPHQLRAIAELAASYGRGIADITVRQNIQLRWIRIEDVPHIFRRLAEVGLSTFGSDRLRNVITCPVSGADKYELYDASRLIHRTIQLLASDERAAATPRKLKIAMTGCALRCVYPEVHDIGIFAVSDGQGVRFRARVGGGLSLQPRFSKDLGIAVEPEQVPELCAAIAAALARRGLAVETDQLPDLRTEVEAQLGRKLQAALDETIPPRDRSHLGIHPQRQGGLYYVGIALIGGRASGRALGKLALLAEEYGCRIRTSNAQNIFLLDVPESNLSALKRELKLAGLDCEPGWARRGIIACTGTEFCKLAIAETKGRAAQLSDSLEGTIEMDQPIRISIAGCPNSCGQHAISDIGLEGCLVTIGEAKSEAFQVYLGGGVGARESFGRKIGARIPSGEVAERLARLLARYKEERFEGESFQDFCQRHTDQELAAYMGLDAS